VPSLLYSVTGTKAEVGGLEQQGFALAHLQPLVRGLERELDGDGSIGGDFLQDRFSASDETGRGNDLVEGPALIIFPDRMSCSAPPWFHRRPERIPV
jgi:hypothetical protein